MKPTIVLCYLITSRLVLVEIVFAIEAADRLDLAILGDGCAKGWEEGGGLEFLCRMNSRFCCHGGVQYEPADCLEKQGRTRQH
jgi:hypothetical protein